MLLEAIVAFSIRAAAPSPAAVVNGRPITNAELARATADRIRKTRFHRNPEPDEVQAERRKALDALVTEELRAQEARRRGLAPDPQVAEVAAAEEKAAGGQQAFEKVLARNGIDRSRYLEVIARPSLAAKLEQAELAKIADPNDAEARAAYASDRGRYIVPEALHVRETCIRMEPLSTDEQWEDGRERAEALRTRIAGGADFAAEAKALACDKFAPQGGDLGLVHRGSIDEALEKAAWALHDGEASPPVRTFRGWHVVLRVETRPARPAAFEEVEGSIRSELHEARRKRAIQELDDRLRGAAVITRREDR